MPSACLTISILSPLLVDQAENTWAVFNKRTAASANLSRFLIGNFRLDFSDLDSLCDAEKLQDVDLDP